MQSDRDDVYRELGQYYLKLIESENSIDAEVAEMRNRIYNYNAEIAELEKEIDE